MTQALAYPFRLPGDRDWIEKFMKGKSGLGAVAKKDSAFLHRAIAGLGPSEVVELAEGSADGALLYRFWLDHHHGHQHACAIWYNLGVAMMAAGKLPQAEEALNAAVRLRPDLWQAARALGLVYERQGMTGQALAAWRRVLPPPDERLRLHNELGRVLEKEGRLGEAAAELRASLLIDPDQPDVLQHLLHNRQRMAAWPPLETNVPGIDLQTATLRCGPLATLALVDDPAQHRAVAEDWIGRKVPPAPHLLAPAGGYRHRRIRLGYLSSDFCRHAMSFLIASVIEQHDRKTFEVYGYCSSPEDGSDIRTRVIAAFDQHIVIRDMDDEAAATRIRSDEIDILIDLNGLTRGARLGVLRWKPARVQMTYLGYIGPVPLPELDWMLCDEITVPAAHDGVYLPPPLRITGCFQANDSQKMDLPAVSRAAEGLPEEGFVFVCFSHHYKITESMFGAWCEILRAVPESVLWLVDDNPESQAALKRHASFHGVLPERLIFAPRVAPAHYRARLSLADLFLDTTPYNAGTVASDALRMGLPIVTVLGKSFAARMAASLLTNVGLTECIAPDLAGYISLARDLAGDGARLDRLRCQLREGAWERTLGDAKRFTRNLETALLKVVDRSETKSTAGETR